MVYITLTKNNFSPRWKTVLLIAARMIQVNLKLILRNFNCLKGVNEFRFVCVTWLHDIVRVALGSPLKSKRMLFLALFRMILYLCASFDWAEQSVLESRNLRSIDGKKCSFHCLLSVWDIIKSRKTFVMCQETICFVSSAANSTFLGSKLTQRK